MVFLAIYGLTAGVSLGRHSLAPHFVYLAESFLHGQLDLLHVPDPPYDLTLVEGHWYVSFPPLPAVLMLPLVALRGLAVSDIAFSVVLGALSISLFHLVLSRLGIGSLGVRIWMCVLLGLGTPLWYCSALGSVWYTAHVAAAVCLCLYALEVVGRNRPFWAGLWLCIGFLARAPVLLAFPLSLVPGFLRARGRRQAVQFLLLFALGAAPGLLAQAAYNYVRFGNPLEFGYRWMNSPGQLVDRQVAWGQFSVHFLPENLYTLLIRPPLISLTPFRVTPDPWGMGLLLTCPALVLALRRLCSRGWKILSWDTRGLPGQDLGRRLSGMCSGLSAAFAGENGRVRRLDALYLGLWLAVALVLVPSLLYFNTGSYQFGYRFALDWLPLGVLLVAFGVDDGLPGWGRALIVVSVLMHLWGVLWMYPNFNSQPWHLQYVQLAHGLLRGIFDVAR